MVRHAPVVTTYMGGFTGVEAGRRMALLVEWALIQPTIWFSSALATASDLVCT
jgi:hypothetical protein